MEKSRIYLLILMAIIVIALVAFFLFIGLRKKDNKEGFYKKVRDGVKFALIGRPPTKIYGDDKEDIMG